MTNSMDQNLASRLTSGRVLWVVLDPSNADAVLTDNVDESFWQWLGRAYPGTAKATPSGTANDASRAQSAKHAGTVFLVDPRRRLVLWSVYDAPKSSAPNDLDRSALRITNQLKLAFGRS
jgi:hypothetical protein